MNHVMWCPSYSELRADKDMNDYHDVARYLHDVMIIRSKLDLHRHALWPLAGVMLLPGVD